MSYEAIKYETQDGIAYIRLNRPKALNAITPQMLRELNEAIASAGEDPEVEVVVLTGEGRAFSAGVDLKALGKAKLDEGGVGTGLNDPACAFIRALETLPKITIAQINGFCFTGALEIAMGCDLIVVADEAKLGDTHAKWGLRPTWGMSQRLPRIVGVMKARELSYTAETFTGKEAEAMGLALRSVPLDQLDETVRELAKKIAANSPQALAAYKTLYNETLGDSLKTGLKFERESVFDITDSAERLAQFAK